MKPWVVTSCIVLAALVLVALQGMVRREGVLPPQPIAFNHRRHLEAVQGVGCHDCHQFVRTHTYAGLPSKHVCFGCHSPEADESEAGADALQPRFAPLMAFAKSAEDIPWHRVTALADDVFFSHRRHVTVGKLDCRECHPRMPDRTSPPTRGPVHMSMEECIDCHEGRKVSADCVSCHR